MSALVGATVWLSHARGGTPELADMLRARGAVVLRQPLIEIHPLADARHPTALRQCCDADWLLITSRHAVRHFLQHVTCAAAARPKVAAVGAATAQCLRDHRWPANTTGDDGGIALAQHLCAHFDVAGKTFFYPCSQHSAHSMAQHLRDNGARVIRHPVYTALPPRDADFTAALRSDAVVLCSGTAVAHFAQLRDAHPHAPTPAIVAIGTFTARALRAAGIHRFATAQTPTPADMVAATAQALGAASPTAPTVPGGPS